MTYLTDRNHPDYLENIYGEEYDLNLELNNFNKLTVLRDLNKEDELYTENDEYKGSLNRYLKEEETSTPIYIGITVHDYGIFDVISPSWTGPDKTVTTMEAFVTLYEQGVNMTLTNPERFPEIAAKMKADEDAYKSKRQLEREERNRLKGTSYAELDEKLNGRDIVDDIMDDFNRTINNKGYKLKVRNDEPVKESAYAEDLNRFTTKSSQDAIDNIYKGEIGLFDNVPDDLLVDRQDSETINSDEIIIKDVDKLAMRKYVRDNNISADHIISGAVRIEDFAVKRMIKEKRIAKLKRNLSRRKNQSPFFN